MQGGRGGSHFYYAMYEGLSKLLQASILVLLTIPIKAWEDVNFWDLVKKTLNPVDSFCLGEKIWNLWFYSSQKKLLD